MQETDPQKQLAAALGRLPSGLFVATFSNGTDVTGMLVSWVQQCSFAPPQLSMALQPGRPVTAWLGDAAPFVLNVLDAAQTDMIVHFGRGFALGTPAFEGLDLERSPRGLPILADALAFLECTVAGRVSTGDHDLFIGRIVTGRVLGDGQPMVHVRKSGLHY